MDDTKGLVINHLELARRIASKYMNIKGMSREEVLSEANIALIQAARSYDPSKGSFAPYAFTVIKNALNSIFIKQNKNARFFPKSIDETLIGGTKMGTNVGNMAQNIPDIRENVVKDVRSRETSRQVRGLLGGLAHKEKKIIEMIGKGMSLSEIGKELGVSKQAVFKAARPALDKIKSLLLLNGYEGIDSDGLLKTKTKDSLKHNESNKA